jgi:hypothetical protein
VFWRRWTQDAYDRGVRECRDMIQEMFMIKGRQFTDKDIRQFYFNVATWMGNEEFLRQLMIHLHKRNGKS